MQSEIEFLKRQFDKIAELVKGRIYALTRNAGHSDGSKSSITPLGQRMRSDTPPAGRDYASKSNKMMRQP